MTKKPTTTTRPATQGKTTPFEMELNRSIRKTMAELQREGTTGMSVENLRMIVRTPSTGLQGAPLGTNAQYYYAEMFARLVRAMKITGFSILK